MIAGFEAYLLLGVGKETRQVGENIRERVIMVRCRAYFCCCLLLLVLFCLVVMDMVVVVVASGDSYNFKQTLILFHPFMSAVNVSNNFSPLLPFFSNCNLVPILYVIFSLVLVFLKFHLILRLWVKFQLHYLLSTFSHVSIFFSSFMFLSQIFKWSIYSSD